jgi:lysozyme family protein
MALIAFSDNLKNEYDNLFNNCQVSPERAPLVESIITKIVANKPRYEAVGNKLKIPWYFIGVIHNMESSLNFTKHLHNGDPLTARTKQVPAGRPAEGNPPFTWEQSAEDSLKLMKLDQWTDWSLPAMLYKIEAYNGFGYRSKHPSVLSPYLWSFSNHYTKGKYVADGTWSDTAVSNQCGAAVILRRMAERGDFAASAVNFVKPKPAAVADVPTLKYSDKQIPYGEELQLFLNKFPGIFVKVDGCPGERSSDAFKKIFGVYLLGDPRG